MLFPMAWKTYAHHRPSFDDNPRITQTGDGHPGDPLNVSLIGTKEQIDTIMKAAKWYPAAALGSEERPEDRRRYGAVAP